MAIFDYLETLRAILCFLFLFHRSWKNKKPLVTNWSFIGMLPGLLCNLSHINEYAFKILKLSGYTFECKGPWFTNMEFILTSDPANIHHILVKNFSYFEKGPSFKTIFEVWGDGIFISESDSWKMQRKLTHSVFKHIRFHQLLEKTTQGKVEKGLLPVLEHASKQGIEIDLQDMFRRFTFDSTCMLICGFDPGCLSVELPQVLSAKAFDEIEEVLFYRHTVPEFIWRLQKWLQIGEEKKLSRARVTLDKFLDQHISMKQKLRRSKIPAGFDLLTNFMEEAEKEHQNDALNITDKFLRDTVFNLLSAGRGTVSAALTWFFWLVATNPLIEAKIKQEIKVNIEHGEKWKLFSAQEANKLVYLHGALCESLRLHPLIPFNRKEAVEADTLPSGHRVGRNTKILFSLYATGRMEDVWGED